MIHVGKYRFLLEYHKPDSFVIFSILSRKKAYRKRGSLM